MQPADQVGAIQAILELECLTRQQQASAGDLWRAVIDTREQRPLPIAPLIDSLGLPWLIDRGPLRTGDYTIGGLEDLILIERKALPDLVACVGLEREPFVEELERLATETRAPVLLIEGSLADVMGWRYRGDVAPSLILESVAAWTLDYRLRVFWAGSRTGAANLLVRLLAAAVGRAMAR